MADFAIAESICAVIREQTGVEFKFYGWFGSDHHIFNYPEKDSASTRCELSISLSIYCDRITLHYYRYAGDCRDSHGKETHYYLTDAQLTVLCARIGSILSGWSGDRL